MSHELRTPLNAIIGFSEVIISKTLGPLGPEVYDGYVRDINASGVHLLEIINDILDLSKAEAGHLELVEDWVDVDAAIAASVRLLRPRAEQAGVALDVEVQLDLPLLYGDERKLKQILINLLSNAVKFTPQGGSVRVEAGPDLAGGLFIRVVDTGIGMAAEEIPKALEPFRQIDNRLARKYDGTGLGLPLTAAMLRLHGGALTIESVPGAGTTATASFPRERAQLAAEAAE
jgi:signal transduction histidine kinase